MSPGVNGGRHIGIPISSARSQSDVMSTREEEAGAAGPAGHEPVLYSGGELPVDVAVRRHVVDDRGSGGPSKAEKDNVEPVVVAESVSCVELLGKEVGCAIVVAAAIISAEPVPPSIGMSKNESKTV